MTSRHWWAVIFAGWVGVLVASSFYQNPSDWLVVRNVKIFDTIEGISPKMEVSRVVRKPFRGQWLAEVSAIHPDGSVSAVCAGSGQNRYEPEDKMPPNLDLDWWTYPIKCNLPVGRYYVDTVWTLRPIGVNPMEVTFTSNEFEVKPRNAH